MRATGHRTLLTESNADSQSLELDAEEPEDTNKILSLRHCIWEFLSRSPEAPRQLRRAAFVYEICMCISVVALVFLDAVIDIWQSGKPVYYVLEGFLIFVLILEYVLQLYCCVEDPDLQVGNPRNLHCCSHCSTRLWMALRPSMLLSALIIIALMADSGVVGNAMTFQGIPFLRVLRVFSLLRIERQLPIFGIMFEVLWEKRRELRATYFLAMMILLVTAVLMHKIENPVNANYKHVTDSMWWATTALTTVGYGDIYPITPVGKMLASVVAFFGVGLFAIPSGIIASGFTEHTKPDNVHHSVLRLESKVDSMQAEIVALRSSIDEISVLLNKSLQTTCTSEASTSPPRKSGNN